MLAIITSASDPITILREKITWGQETTMWLKANKTKWQD